MILRFDLPFCSFEKALSSNHVLFSRIFRFRGTKVPSPRFLTNSALELVQELDAPCPPLPFDRFATRYLQELGLDNPRLGQCVGRFQLVLGQELVQRVVKDSIPAEARVMACILACLKMLYGLDRRFLPKDVALPARPINWMQWSHEALQRLRVGRERWLHAPVMLLSDEHLAQYLQKCEEIFYPDAQSNFVDLTPFFNRMSDKEQPSGANHRESADTTQSAFQMALPSEAHPHSEEDCSRITVVRPMYEYEALVPPGLQSYKGSNVDTSPGAVEERLLPMGLHDEYYAVLRVCAAYANVTPSALTKCLKEFESRMTSIEEALEGLSVSWLADH
mmetsp:Transcript_2283/g.8161  ORF Transcript_2283/g.8161 Transcript_2283/m.8161 type:complete len:334 (-) Transcript_2283:2986-3987(-)